MEVIILLILASLLLAGGFLAVFIWASRSGQFEDTTTPAMRMLVDDPAPKAGSIRQSPKPKHP
ncbi:MAG: cbb3-type cytochrome oxidase assembly protein CcoS [Verrucomicrobiales bacterium]|nr:cbb3-type cytochrome oxidase assembly protein CcoS [Verrucomicrobiales bacterium]